MAEREDFEMPPSQREALEEVHREHLLLVNHQNPEPPVWGESFLKKVDLALLKLENWVGRVVPEDLNPLTQTGALANASLILCLITGIIILLWYKTSVHLAYQSLESIRSLWYAQLIRSLHRYTADVAMFFVLLHAFQIFVARRFSGPRWIAWVTGVFLLFLLWLDGWTGYWLVWDERGQQVAVFTAKLLDYLPLFAEPLQKSFLTDHTINSLVFFLVFFFHMLIPLGMVLALWLHIIRLNSPRFLPTKRMWWLTILAFLLISLLFPATSSSPAKMQRIQGQFTMDLFFLFPLYLQEWLSAGWIWLSAFLGTLAFLTVPWWMTRKHREAAHVLETRCNGCGLCYQDCPYDAIRLVPTPEGRWEQRAEIDPSKCVGCGVCVGACNPGAIIFPKLPIEQVRKKLDEWLRQKEEAKFVAFLCASSAGSDLAVDPKTGLSPQLPGYRVIPVPCSSWVNPILIERTLKKGAEGVLVVGCGPDPRYRVGTKWTELRIRGERAPVLRKEKIKPGKRVRFLRYDRALRSEFLKEAREFLEEKEEKKSSFSPLSPLLAFLLLTLLCLFSVFFNFVPYLYGRGKKSELVISFRHPGAYKEVKREKKQENLLPHMRGKGQLSIRRERYPVQMQVWIDGKKVLDKFYPPSGVFRDGASAALEYIPIPPGEHEVWIRLGDRGDGSWQYEKKVFLTFSPAYRRVILFDRLSGFQVY